MLKSVAILAVNFYLFVYRTIFVFLVLWIGSSALFFCGNNGGSECWTD